MNKREKTIISAFGEGRDFTLWAPDGNPHDRVRCCGMSGERSYWLWRTRIACLKGRTLTLSLGGYTTNTTLSRVDAFCAAYGLPVGIRRRGGEAVLVSIDGVPRHFGYWYSLDTDGCPCIRWKIER